MSTDKMLAEKRGAIGIMTFNNPERHNAVSLEMWEAADRILSDFIADPAIRVVVITGAGGRSFVSGADISKFDSERASLEGVRKYNAAVERMYGGIYELPKPTIAMIRGYCMGGGLGLAISCDIRVCNETSKFALPAAKLGLGYGFTPMKRFVDVLGPAVTKEIFFTARQYDAATALRWNMVNHVVPDAEIEAFVMSMAETIAGNAPLTVGSIKAIAQQIVKDPTQRDLGMCDAMVEKCFASQDYIEGRRAFMEKRKPVFTGS
ncbi:MAG: enoyl-CoA hydratase/isomerase family protein [Alphaproteobacteria bacterium]|nr:enoyl-CoA hydratase/isomerase family protein [Alphaproteobacteria bacterium]